MTADRPRPLSVVETVEQVRSGHLSPVESVTAALDRIDATHRLHAVDQVRREEAMAEAAAVDPDAPLAGVSVLVKAEFDVAGVVTTYGGRAGRLAEADSEVVRRLRAAGAVVVGTTHMPEFGQFPFTEGAWGATRNPWDESRTPGGSSGGSAAAVAAGLVPVALGGDGGGSIRIPASCCGLVGLKPVRGRVSAAPYSDLWGTLGTIGPLTRSVADTALVYDVIAGSTDTDLFTPAPASSTFSQAAAQEPRPLRIGWLTQAPWPGVRTDSEVRAAVQHVADVLAEAGHRVDHLDGRWPDAQPTFVPQFFAAIRDEQARVADPSLLEPRTQWSARAGRLISAGVLDRAVLAGERLARRVEEQFADYDVVFTPTLACIPPPVGRLRGAGVPRALQRSMPMVAFTSLANATGHAAMSVPAGLGPSGLPIGVQLYAPGGDETRLLPLAAQLEGLLSGC